MMSVYESIVALLDGEQILYRVVHHAPTRTSAESARARGEELRIGGKALVMKVGRDFQLFVLSAALQLNPVAIKQHFGVKKLRFASPEELRETTGLTPGGVPPFGRPILPFSLFVDPSILENTKIAFNAGMLTTSIIMPVEDYIRVANPIVLPFALQA